MCLFISMAGKGELFMHLVYHIISYLSLSLALSLSLSVGARVFVCVWVCGCKFWYSSYTPRSNFSPNFVLFGLCGRIVQSIRMNMQVLFYSLVSWVHSLRSSTM